MIPGSDKTDCGNNPSISMTSLFFICLNRPSFRCLVSARFPTLVPYDFSFPFLQAGVGDTVCESNFRTRGIKDSLLAKSNIFRCSSHFVPFSKLFTSFRKRRHSFLFWAQQRTHKATDRGFLWNIFHRLTISWESARGVEMHSWDKLHG